MNIKITNQKGIVLKTKDKLCEEDIVVVPDESILGGTTYETYDGETYTTLTEEDWA